MGIRWTGQALKDLFELSAKEVSEKYGLTTDGVYTKRKKIKRKALKDKHRMEKDPTFIPNEAEQERIEYLERTSELLQEFKDAGLPVDPSDAPNVKEITIWTQHSVDRETGEPVMAINRRVKMRNEEMDEEEKDIFPQATAARITPTRRKGRKDDEKRILIIADPQIGWRRRIDGKTGEMSMTPLHDEPSIRLMHQIAADMQPDEIWNAGDTIDLPELSRFAPDSDHFFKTMGAALQTVHDMYAQLRADNPNARIIEVDSNHNDRLKNTLLKFMPQLYDIYRPGDDSEYSMTSYPYMANLEILGVEFVGGYGAAQYEYGTDYYEEINGRTYPRPPIQLRHGTETSSNGTTASKIQKNHPDTINVHGHNHNAELYFSNNRLGQMVGSIVVPPLCSTTGEVPGYHTAVNEKNEVVPYQEKWTNGIVELIDHNGDYEFNLINFHRGVAYYRGKRYEA